MFKFAFSLNKVVEQGYLTEHSAGGVVYRLVKGGDQLYLILMNRRKKWEFPKGHIEAGETPLDAALREVKEETGLKTLEVLPNFQQKVSYMFIKEGKTIRKDVIYFIMKTGEDVVKVNDEHLGYMWLDYERAINTLSHKNSKSVLRAADKWINLYERAWRI